ncbi:MAG: hypothetical protein J7J15_02460 [Candidatus Aenigmarchaeota archaeon]|nr:hypothetical protein [Candidatus Aenigmarchaeota archaeon]
MRDKIDSLADIREKANRPPNVFDYILIEICGETIPEDERAYTDLIISSERTEEYITLISSIKEEYKKIEDLLIQDNVLYAIEKSKPYQKKYGDTLSIKDPDNLIRWVKKNIKESEDLEHLPPLTNDDIRKPELYPYGWWIPSKIPAKTFQSGASTGKPAYIPYSIADYEIACMYAAEGLKKYANVQEGDKVLLLVPPDPHPYGPACSCALEKIGCVPIWKHFKNFSTEQILSQIEEVKPDVLITAPHGPKGAAGALDVLLKTDQEMGTNILPIYLKNKKIVSGGAPINKELVDELYGEVYVKRIVNGYGSAQVMGAYSTLTKRKRNDNVRFFSEVEIPSGYWVVTPINDEEAPEGWSRYGITVLGREIMPIIKFDHGDYGMVDLENRKIEDICRVEWFFKNPDGTITVKIPPKVNTCISEV